jgi:hypothetical protein
MTMHAMMNGEMTGMIWGTGLIGLIFLALIVLGIAAIIKYLFF